MAKSREQQIFEDFKLWFEVPEGRTLARLMIRLDLLIKTLWSNKLAIEQEAVQDGVGRGKPRV